MTQSQLFTLPITLDDQIKELSRELQMRSHVSPRLIKQGSLTKQEAEYRMAALQAAITTLKGLQEGIIS